MVEGSWAKLAGRRVICTSWRHDETFIRQTKEVVWQAHSKAQR